MSSRTNKWLVASIALACLIGGLAIAGFEMLRIPPAEVAENTARATSPPADTPAPRPRSGSEEAYAEESNLIDDDGRTLWASPTSGPPLDLAYLPPGSQIILALRPAALAAHPEFDKVFDSLGPLGLRGGQFVDDALHNPAGVERAILGCRVTRDGMWEVAVVASLTGGKTAAEHLAAQLPGALRKEHHGRTYWVDDRRAYYVPAGAGSKDSLLLVVASPEAITEIIDLGGNPPPLRRDIERLLADTDADRQVTLIVAPNFLFGEGQSMFGGEMARLRGPLFWFLGDSLSAAALSMNWDENFFIEFLATPILDTPPDQAARHLAKRVAEMPELVEDYVVRLDPQPYGRRVVARFPAMVRKLAAYTRTGVEADHVVMRCYLPAVAGHNLLMGAVLTLAEAPAAGMPGETIPVAEVSRVEATSPTTGTLNVRELLLRPTSLKVSRDSLEATLEQLSQNIGVEIVILGPDLQADGITRNQQLAIDMENRPAEDILVEILRRANPDKLAVGPADPRQKLVYVVKAKEPVGPEAILITTRARTAERGERLPEVFEP